MAKEQWLDPWCEQFYTHTRPIQKQEKRRIRRRPSKPFKSTFRRSYARNEVAALPYPYGFGPGLFKSLFNLCLGIKKEDLLEIERSATIKVWIKPLGTLRET